jgi:hypothetical protein
MVISEKNSGEFWCIFFRKILCVSLIGLYFLLPSDQNSPQKKTLVLIKAEQTKKNKS